MNLERLISSLLELQTRGVPRDAEVRLIVGGVAHDPDAVWWEPGQEEHGAVCVGDDPR